MNLATATRSSPQRPASPRSRPPALTSPLPPATQLVLTTPPPSELTAGTGFGLIVDAEDDQGQIDTNYNSMVTVALASGPSGSSLGGTVTVTAINGVATFSGLTLDTAGTGYTLQLSSGNLRGVDLREYSGRPGGSSLLRGDHQLREPGRRPVPPPR